MYLVAFNWTSAIFPLTPAPSPAREEGERVKNPLPSAPRIPVRHDERFSSQPPTVVIKSDILIAHRAIGIFQVIPNKTIPFIRLVEWDVKIDFTPVGAKPVGASIGSTRLPGNAVFLQPS
jgi:hypothetical protein